MSQFYAEIKGSAGKASRIGTKKSGMWAHIRGWGKGVLVVCSFTEQQGDVIEVYLTGGSHNPKPLTSNLLDILQVDKS